MPTLSLLPGLYRDYAIRTTVQLAQTAERAGYDGVWYADERFQRDTYVVLGAIAGATERVVIGPAVTDPYTRHPAITAASIATLDELSGGRARLGIGAGIAGFTNLGIELRQPATAVAEAISAIRLLLAGETVTVDGKVISLRDGRLKFLARVDIPIHVAADRPAMLRAAGRHADGVIVAHAADAGILATKLHPARESRANRDGRLRVIARLDVTVNDIEERALDAARVRVGRVLWASYPDLDWIRAAGHAVPSDLENRLKNSGPFPRTHDLTAFRHLADAIPDDIIPLVAIAGREATLAARFSELFRAGVDELMIHPLVSEGETETSAVEKIGNAMAQATRAGVRA